MKPLKWIRNVLEHLKEEPNAFIVEEPTSEKTTMTKMIEEPAVFATNWSIDRINKLSESNNKQDHLDAIAIGEEFDEWIYADDKIECISITDDQWTDEQEIDVK
jgi:hypothetical protein